MQVVCYKNRFGLNFGDSVANFLNNIRLAIIGLGYVGLPLAVEFGKKRPVVGFDIHQNRINELDIGHDHTLEVSDDELQLVGALTFAVSEARDGR